jgi:hypothetical protein
VSVLKKLKKIEMWGNEEQQSLLKNIAELTKNHNLLFGKVNFSTKQTQQFAILFDSSYTNANTTFANILQSNTTYTH